MENMNQRIWLDRESRIFYCRSAEPTSMKSIECVTQLFRRCLNMFDYHYFCGKSEINVLDQIYGTFNSYRVDLENRKLKVSLSPNLKRFPFMTYDEMIQCEKEGWDCKNLNYTIDRYGNLEMDIPENHEVLVILK